MPCAPQKGREDVSSGKHFLALEDDNVTPKSIFHCERSLLLQGKVPKTETGNHRENIRILGSSSFLVCTSKSQQLSFPDRMEWNGMELQVLTALAFVHFARERVDVAVVEVCL